MCECTCEWFRVVGVGSMINVVFVFVNIATVAIVAIVVARELAYCV